MSTLSNPDLDLMDRNPMFQSLYNPIMQTGVVPGKALPDHLLIDERMANAEDPGIAKDCYGGGGQEKNHDIWMGDPVYGLKCVRSPEVMAGHPNEVVTATVAGLYLPDFGSQHAAERQVYFVGVSQTDYRYSGNPSGSSLMPDPEHGIATVKTGTCSVINNGPFVQYAGGYVMYRYPPSAWSPYAMVDGDNSFETAFNKRARVGEQPTRIRPELVPFDYTDFATELAGAAHLMESPSGMNRVHGISDMLLSEFLSRKNVADSTNYSAEQEVAAGHKWGTIGAVLAGCLEYLFMNGLILAGAGAIVPSSEAIKASEKLINDCGFWDAKSRIPLDMFERVFFRDLPFANGNRIKGELLDAAALTQAYRNAADVAGRYNFENNSQVNYQKMRFFASQLAMGAVSGNFFFKTSKIIGRSMNCAAPSDTMHLLLGHFVL